MEDKETIVERLVNGGPGIDRHDAELRMVDDDLWILPPEQRHGFEADEAIRQWEQAARFMRGLAGLTSDPGLLPEATQMVLDDARFRAEEALRRAYERRDNGF